MKLSPDKKVTIVGAGFSGLSLAYFLRRRGWQVTLFNQNSDAGGLAGGFQEKGWQWPLDSFYHHLFRQDNSFRRWLREMFPDLSIDYYRPKTSLLLNGKVIPFDNPADLWQLPDFRFSQKIHFGIGVGLLKLSPWLPFFSHQTVKRLPFLLGTKAFNEIWKPLLVSKFGDTWPEVALSWFWARLKSRSSQLGYPQGGFASLADKTLKYLKQNRVTVYQQQKLSRLKPKNNGGWQLTFNGRRHFSKTTVLALPFAESLRLIGSQLPRRQKQQWQQWPNRAALTLILRLKKPFLADGTYWLNILNPVFPFVVVVEHTNFIDPKYYNGEHLVYVGGYYDNNDPFLRQRTATVLKRFVPWLRKIKLDFEDDLIDARVFRAQFAQPVMTPYYIRLLPKLETGLPHLYWLSQNHIFPWDRGLNWSVDNAKKLASLIDSRAKKTT